MKITKSQLKQIIKEEIKGALNEDEESDQRVIQLVERAVHSFTEIFSPEELSLISDRDNRDMFVYYLFENIQLQADDAAEWRDAGGGLGGPGEGPRHPTPEEISHAKAFELEEANKKDSHDEIRRRIEKSMGLEPGSIQSDEELKQAEKERKEKAKPKPQTKSPKRRPKYGHGGTHETWS